MFVSVVLTCMGTGHKKRKCKSIPLPCTLKFLPGHKQHLSLLLRFRNKPKPILLKLTLGNHLGLVRFLTEHGWRGYLVECGCSHSSKGCFGKSDPTGMAAFPQPLDRALSPNSFLPLASSPSLRSHAKAGLHTTGGMGWLQTQVKFPWLSSYLCEGMQTVKEPC